MTDTIHGFSIGSHVTVRNNIYNYNFTVVSYEDWENYQRINEPAGAFTRDFMENYVPVRSIEAPTDGYVTGYSASILDLVEPITKPTVVRCQNCAARSVQTSGFPETTCDECKSSK